MLQSAGLRIGNILEFDGVWCPVTAIDHKLESLSNSPLQDGKHAFTELSSGRIKEVAITEEVLHCAYFEKTKRITETINKYSISSKKFVLYFNGEYAGLITSLPRSVPIHYLHQLQNLYFSLIGEELAINLPVPVPTM